MARIIVLLTVIMCILMSCTSGSAHRTPRLADKLDSASNADQLAIKKVKVRSLWYSDITNKYYPRNYLEPATVDTVFKSGDTVKLDGSLYVIQ